MSITLGRRASDGKHHLTVSFRHTPSQFSSKSQLSIVTPAKAGVADVVAFARLSVAAASIVVMGSGFRRGDNQQLGERGPMRERARDCERRSEKLLRKQ